MLLRRYRLLHSSLPARREAQMENLTSNETLFFDRGPGYVAYKFILFLVLLVPVAVFDVLIIVGTLADKTVNNAVRVVLLNIPIACLFVAAGFAGDHIAATSLTLSKLPLFQDPALFPCQLIVYLIAFGGAARLVCMALFAVTAYLIVKIGAKKAKWLYFEIASIAIWLFLAAFTTIVFIPAVADYEYDDGVSCRPVTNGAGTYIFIGIEMIFFCFIPFGITIVMPILTLCHLKNSFITEDLTLKKVLVKFALFLILGNTLAVIGLAVPVLISALSPADSNPTVDTALLRTANIITHLSLFPTPILILVYFPSIRKKIWELLGLCFCLVCRKAGCTYKRPGEKEKLSSMENASPTKESIVSSTNLS